jgi:enoyl-CoA hydratase/carnithine racemase
VGEFVTVSTDEQGVATVRLDRAPVNALNPQVWQEFAEAATQLEADESIAAAVIWGGPKVFAAGADIKAMKDMTFQSFMSGAGKLQETFKLLARVPKVVIAAVNGYALGAGCELALTADFRYAADNAQFGQPEVLLGVIPGAGGTQRLSRIVGVQKAKEMIYDGGFHSAEQCLAMGLVDRVFPAEQVYDRAVEAARRYARGPFALRLAKKAIDEGAEMDLDSALRLETTLFTACFATEDQRAGMESFLAQGPGKATFVRR